jgi:hypothetical protein
MQIDIFDIVFSDSASGQYPSFPVGPNPGSRALATDSWGSVWPDQHLRGTHMFN